MKFRKNNFSSPKQQQGLALLAALLVITLMTIIGFRIAEQGKTNTEITGSNVRYNQVFEAGELTLRNAMAFIQNIKNGQPIATDNPSVNYLGAQRNIFKNFDRDNISIRMVNLPSFSFVWKGGALEQEICGGSCDNGLNFNDYIDPVNDVDIWARYAIPSVFTADDSNIDGNNYLSNIRTYTFIESISQGSSKGATGGASKEFGKNSQRKYHYLITVKASGYPPGTPEGEMTAENARENVILQAVFALTE